MANLKEIKNRISSVKNTQKMTKAMKMVSAAKLVRVQDKLVAFRNYHRGFTQILNFALQNRPEGYAHPLLTRNDSSTVLIVTFSSDKGLCGGFNGTIFKATDRLIREKIAAGRDVELMTIGKKAHDFFRNTKRKSVANLESATASVADVSRQLEPLYLDGTYGEIWLCFNRFKSSMSYEATTISLFPVGSSVDAESSPTVDVIFEPNFPVLMDAMLRVYTQNVVQFALLNSWTSEHSSRMIAMDSATNNSREMISKLTLLYNRARQAAITTELIEIVSSAEAISS